MGNFEQRVRDALRWNTIKSIGGDIVDEAGNKIYDSVDTQIVSDVNNPEVTTDEFILGSDDPIVRYGPGLQVYNSSLEGMPSSIKAHRDASITSPVTNTWTNVSGFSVNDPESPTDYMVMDEDNTTFSVNQDGLYQFNGCFKVQNNSGGNQTVTVLIRLITNGSEEMRCSQRQHTVTFQAGSATTLVYGGTDDLHEGDNVTLQYWINNADVSVRANDEFQDPSAVTFIGTFLGEIPA